MNAVPLGAAPSPPARCCPTGRTPGSQDALVAGIEADEVRSILDLLPADQREVVVLRFLVDLPLAEVASITGRSLAGVKALQHRGLARLRHLVEDPARDRAPFPATRTFTTS